MKDEAKFKNCAKLDELESDAIKQGLLFCQWVSLISKINLNRRFRMSLATKIDAYSYFLVGFPPDDAVYAYGCCD